MEEFNGQAPRCETVLALERVEWQEMRGSYPAYVGLDVHKESIAVAVARSGREAAENWGEIANRPRRGSRR